MLSTDLINGQHYWTDKHDPNKALWFNAKNKFWVIGQMMNIGSNIGYFKSKEPIPYEATTWYYWNYYYWRSTFSDVVVELGE